ncbi:hypothetical protein Tco_0343395 [Tanacetum coccineum]
MSKYSTTGSSVISPSPTLGSSFWGLSSSRIILMNITSPSSSLEHTNFVLEDWGTNPSDSSIELSFRTCFVAMEANQLGCGYGLELAFSRFSSSSSMLGSSTWDSSGCLGWIVMVLIELWICVEHYGSIVGYTTYLPLRRCARMRIQQRLVVSEQDKLPSSVKLDFRARLDGGRMYSGHLKAMVEVTKLTTGQLVNGSSCDGIDMVIKDLDLEPKIDAMMRDFLD